MPNFIFDECAAAMLGSGTPLDWANDDIYAGMYSDATPMSEALDYATAIGDLTNTVSMTGRSVDSVGRAVSDAVQFVSVLYPEGESVGGMVIYRLTPDPILIYNLQAGTSLFDYAPPPFGMAGPAVTVTVRPNATHGGWFRP